MFNIFKKQRKNIAKQERSFKGAVRTRFTSWLASTFSKVNRDLENDFVTLVTRCRDLSKNNEIVRSFLWNVEKSVIGNTGFKLQCYNKNSANDLDTALNDAILWAWYDYGKKTSGTLTKNGTLDDIAFDALILRTILVDGEAFIRIHKSKSKYGICFELLDTCCIDFNKRQEFGISQNAIIGRY